MGALRSMLEFIIQQSGGGCNAEELCRSSCCVGRRGADRKIPRRCRALKGGEQNVTVLTVFGVGPYPAVSGWQPPDVGCLPMFGLASHSIATPEPKEPNAL